MSPIMKFNYTEFNGKLLSHFSFTYIKRFFQKEKNFSVSNHTNSGFFIKINRAKINGTFNDCKRGELKDRP